MLAEKTTLQESHKVKCPYCKEWIEQDFLLDSRCPNCHKKLIMTCVICKKDFFKKEIGSMRQCCYNEECVQKFRYHCGIDDRFWRTLEQKRFAEKYNIRRKKKIAKKKN